MEAGRRTFRSNLAPMPNIPKLYFDRQFIQMSITLLFDAKVYVVSN